MFEEFPAQKLTGLLSLITTKAKRHKDFFGLFPNKCQCPIPLQAKYYIFNSYFCPAESMFFETIPLVY
jgi:hypothetical protein